MRQRDHIYWYGLALLLVVFGVFQALRPSPIDWRVTLEADGDNPYDLRALYTVWPDLAQDKPIRERVRSNIWLMGEGQADTSSTILLVSEGVTLSVGEYSVAADSLEYQTLTQFLGDGGTLALVADGASSDLNPLGLSPDWSFADDYRGFITPLSDTLAYVVRLESSGQRISVASALVPTALEFTGRGVPDIEEILIEGVGLPETMASICTDSCGDWDAEWLPILVRVPVGEGSVVVTTAARLLTNIALLDHNTLPFADALARALPDAPIVRKVDTFADGRPSSPIYVLTRYPALLWAWYAFLALGVLLVVAYARRRQRPQAPRVAPRNETAAFVSTVAALYRNRGDHANLTRKMASRFRHVAFDAYGLPRRQQTPQNVAERAALSQADAEQLIAWVDRAESGKLTTGSEVEEFAERLTPFFDRAPRTSRLPLSS